MKLPVICGNLVVNPVYFLITESIKKEQSRDNYIILLSIGTSRTVGSAKKFVRIASGFGGGEFTKTLRKVCTCQKLKLTFLLLEYHKM
jgi:hypothetical protein